MMSDLAQAHPRPVVLAAGGTGGHLFPAEALARELLGRQRSVALVTDRRAAAFGDKLPEVPVHRIQSGTFGAGLLAKLRAVAELGIGTVQAVGLLQRLQPRVVVGFGGYPSVPTVAAALALGIPVVLHEQNAVLGRANRLLAGGARTIATSFAKVGGVGPRDARKLVRTGNPVRPGIAALRGTPYRTPAVDGPIHLLVLGGSQGARVFSDVVPAALASLPDELRQRLHLSQQARPEDLERTRTALAPLGLAAAEVQSFFTDVPARLAGAQLVICRASAFALAVW